MHIKRFPRIRRFGKLHKAAASGIYQIINTLNGKKYIGSAENLSVRRSRHILDLEKGTHHSFKLQASWNKHGIANFEFEVLEYVEDLDVLIEREQFWIDAEDSYTKGYNCCPVAGSVRGRKNSQEHIEKTRAGHLGSKRSDQARANMSAAQSARFAERPVSEETRAKQGDARRGKKRKPETGQKIGDALRGKTRSRDHCAALSIAHSSLLTIQKIKTGERHDNVTARQAAEIIGCCNSSVTRSAKTQIPIRGWRAIVTKASP